MRGQKDDFGGNRIVIELLAFVQCSCYNIRMKKVIDCAAKREECDLLLTGANVFNVFSGTFEKLDLAVTDGVIAGLGSGYRAKTTYDASGLYAIAGFIDSHIHVESSMLSPEEFARLSVAHGTSVVIADPHEIVNVCGIAGAEYISEAFGRMNWNGVCPLEVKLHLPSCVPATPFETSGAKIGGRETERELKRGLFFGLGEMMNFPAVVGAEEDCLQKIGAAHALGKIVDGHAPALSGDTLNAYAAAGIRTDHECVDRYDCLEKLKRGLYVQLRNGSSARNLEENCMAMNDYNYRRFVLCSDDRNARDLAVVGQIDDALARLVKCGIPVSQAIAAATINAAECYGLKGKGALAPSYDADVVLVEDLQSFRVRAVFKRGILVAENGKALFRFGRYLPAEVNSTVNIRPVSADDFKMQPKGRARVMKIRPFGLATEEEIVPVRERDGDVVLEHGLCKLAVIERHFATGNLGKCLLRGYGASGGAVGISVAHDSHNLVIAGDNNADMARVASLLAAAGGGMAVSAGGKTESFSLEIAGLMSSASAEEVTLRTEELTKKAKSLGIPDGVEPFMTLAFLSLAVIPQLRLTDKGLYEVGECGIRKVPEFLD